jgi:hypothetical protein
MQEREQSPVKFVRWPGHHVFMKQWEGDALQTLTLGILSASLQSFLRDGSAPENNVIRGVVGVRVHHTLPAHYWVCIGHRSQ